MAGTVVEWYEFFLYGTAATLVFGKSSSPSTGNELDGIIQAFITYAVGFVARPLGGIVFGHYRRQATAASKLLQLSHRARRRLDLPDGLPARPSGRSATGHRPCWWPCASSRASRVGGEWGGAVLLVAEHSPEQVAGFWASWPQAAVPVGNLLATVVLLVLSTTLRTQPFLGWGWRVAFWLSAVIVFVGYYIRTKVTDAPIFLEAKQQVERSQGHSLRRRSRYPQALPAGRLHRDGPAVRREHHVLPGGQLRDRVPQDAGAHVRHLLDPAGSC